MSIFDDLEKVEATKLESIADVNCAENFITWNGLKLFTPVSPVFINKQQTVACKIIKQLEELDPWVLLAGGALRNWDRGMQAIDLDFFLHLPSDLTSLHDELKSILNCSPTPVYSDYRHPDILYVLNGIKYETKIQLIVLKNEVSTIHYINDSFDFDVCKIWMGVDGRVQKSDGYINDISNKQLTYNLTKMSDRNLSSMNWRFNKILKLFPRYTIVFK